MSACSKRKKKLIINPLKSMQRTIQQNKNLNDGKTELKTY